VEKISREILEDRYTGAMLTNGNQPSESAGRLDDLLFELLATVGRRPTLGVGADSWDGQDGRIVELCEQAIRKIALDELEGLAR
jgi:hypothetical protein